MIFLSRLHLAPLSDYDWAAYFEKNHKHRLIVRFDEDESLSKEEMRLIFPSIRMFQAGEASDGRYLLQAVNRYVKQTGDTEYLKSMEWFIAEENRHSAYLKIYMDYYQIAAASNPLLDVCFRSLRRIGGLKSEVIVLMTAEIIALSYYSALSRCTDSAALKAICRQMLHDELYHIAFQSYTLFKLGSSAGEELLRIALMESTLNTVWLVMRNVFEKGGYSYRTFRHDCLGYLRQSIEIARKGEI